MGVKERRTREKEELRQVILDAARELFVSEGVHNVSMRKIADRIEYSPTTIYLYFKDKADLLHHICEEAFAEQIETLEAIKNATPDPLEALRKGLRAYIDHGLKHRSSYILVFMTPQEQIEMSDDFAFEDSLGSKSFDHLRQGVAACVASGVFRDVDVEIVSQSLWAAIHGVTALLLTDMVFPFADQNVLIESVIDTNIRGLLA